MGPCLVRDQGHAEHSGRFLAHILDRADDFDAATLAATPRVYLRLHHPYRPA